MEKNRSKTSSIRLIIVMCIVPWMAVGGQAIMSVAPDMALALNVSDNTIKLVSTIMNITMVPACIIGGIIAGKKVGYKTLMIWSGLALIVSGTLPFFMNNFTMILVTRLIFGAASGLLMPLGVAIIFKLFDGDMRTRVIGFNTTSMFISAVVYTLFGGAIAEISWRYAFLPHLLGLIPMVAVIVLLPNIPKTEPVKTAGKPVKPLVTRMTEAFPLKTIWFILFAFVLQMFMFPVMVNTPFIIVENGLGNAATSSLVLSANTVAGAVSSFAFAFVAKRLKRYALPIALGMCAIGLALIYSANSLPAIFIGTAINGAGAAMMNMSMLLEVGSFIPSESIAIYSGANMAAGSIGGFCLTGYLSLLAKVGFVTAQSSMLVSSIGTAVLTCAMLFYIITSNRRRQVKKAAL